MNDFTDVVLPPPNYRTGCLPRTDKCGDMAPVFEDSSIDIIPPDEWPGLITESQANLVTSVKDQGRTDMCASNATTSCVSSLIRSEHGLAIDLSPSSVYNEIQRGPGGTVISDNLRQARDVGCLPVDTEANRALLRRLGRPTSHVRPAAEYYTPAMTSDEKETASIFRGGEFFDIRSFPGLVTAILLGFPTVYGRSGHAILAVGIRIRGGRIYVVYLNSWGRWGGPAGSDHDYGFGEDSDAVLVNAIGQYGAFAYRTMASHPLLAELRLAA